MSRKMLSSILFVIIAMVAVLFGVNEFDGQQTPAKQTASTTVHQETSSDRSNHSSNGSTSATGTLDGTDSGTANSGKATSGATTSKTCTVINTFDGVANYLRQHDGELPCNYMTKKQAERLGWDSSKGNLAEVAPGKSIGGDTFSNREGLLPKASGR
ncbi:hypothetical protein, partial [Paenibacillus wenxiniae]